VDGRTRLPHGCHSIHLPHRARRAERSPNRHDPWYRRLSHQARHRARTVGGDRCRLLRETQRPPAGFKPDFWSPAPLQALRLTEREAELLLWVAQGKSNAEIATLLGAAEITVKKHLQHIFEKLGI
jgi:ATP/maltotriose-dependent transcriptional regulator MalT